ncbi:2608_t:CDS:1 [Funneliformis geosporum]|uniref:13177_t:CDS:1 n=1 Tax=Funneliformis geosporum TaxID=1117311 RepID=A0A9W4WM07_9GLOM|nr:2608_t:CDS:1 [Funneliformis geosporum]CAI2163892.1 13177_t:CDS:1 [Funneliformis geosporum]
MSSNLFMQVPIATVGAKPFAPLSPPLSPEPKKSAEKSSIYSSHQVTKTSSSSAAMSIMNILKHGDDEQRKSVETLSTKSKPSNKYRMRICDAPPELLEIIKRSEMKNETSLPNQSSPIVNVATKSNVVKSSSDEKRHRIRKNPYPKKAPSKSSPGITLQVDVYTTLREDPQALLRRNEPSKAYSYSTMTGGDLMSLSFTDSSSGTESSPPHSPGPQRLSSKGHIIKTKTKTKRSKPIISERKRKGNSLARVMADRGLLESTLTPIVIAGEIKPIRIPPPPPMQFDELMKSIDQLNLDLTMLHRSNPKIHWKGQPLSISHLPHHNSLHQKEAHVASTLRLTPVQYLTAKHTLISSARRYAQKSLPFRKSDAQKLLRIDVNKASKLWEFFMQVKWI